MKNKKGVEMSMNMVIVAIIALIILALILYLVFTRVIKFNKDCSAEGGQCKADCAEPGFTQIIGPSCPDTAPACCKFTGSG
jgi:hypothetical protein